MMNTDIEQLLVTLQVPAEHRQSFQEALILLRGLGWPAQYVDGEMCEAAIAGRVRRYWGPSCWKAYQRELRRQPPTPVSVPPNELWAVRQSVVKGTWEVRDPNTLEVQAGGPG